MKSKLRYITVSAVIAAAYVGLTFLSSAFGLAYGPVQFRVSEALTILPVFTPAAIPGLVLGCFISNIASFNPIDMIFGTTATLCAALLSYLMRNVRVFRLPVLSAFAPVVINAVVVGAELAVFFVDAQSFMPAFLTSALWVALGEVVTCVFAGLFLFAAINKNRKLKSLISG